MRNDYHQPMRRQRLHLRMTAVEVAVGAAASGVGDHLRAVPAPPPGQHSAT